QVFVFDTGASLRAMTLSMHGAWYALGDDACAFALQPLAGIDEEGERRWAADWVCALLEQDALALTPQVTEEVWQGLESLATAPAAQRTLTGLRLMLRTPALRDALVPYTQAGPYGALLDAPEETWTTTCWQGFEMQRLLEMSRVIHPVLGALFH